tara:strand:- start:128 stop:526 length:399 start_codon:yes stop_codon:yes gene_type:complete
MENIRGYIFSRPFMGERVPQSVQSLLIRDYCNKNNLKFNLHAVEYTMDNCFLVFESCLKELEFFDSIVLYSLFQLPEDDVKRKKYFNFVISKNKKLHFALENLTLNNKKSTEKIEEIWIIKKALPNCIANLD